MTTLHDEVVGVATALTAIDTRCGQAASRLRDLTPEDAGPRAAATTYDEALNRLRRALDDVAADAASAADVVRRFAADDDTRSPEEPR
ncbi:hypothetical protein [Solicola gregarius]|uniref:Uncharacterized protein n=1 Tax=Solicola gregarius TaxID=2908642 RepID=A0AA46TIS0_9ACTN|nr:hypothetical protein [Solicola gregarius]UYM05898.1 hypothetical protein L0C25_02150 [Solicola gregarius]